MANRYWVGGSGSWSATNTANWSASSGGSGGASVPTSSDNVFFNSLSNATAYTVTITAAATCLDFNMSAPLSGNITWAGTLGLSIYGNMSVASTGVTRSFSGAINFTGTSTGLTINCGQNLASAINLSGTGSRTLARAFLTTGIITQTAGTFDTSSTGNYALTYANFLSTGSTTRATYLRASTVTMTGQATFTVSGSNYIFDCGTSNFILSSNNNININANITFYNIRFTNTSLFNLAFQSSFTCNDLTFSARAAAGVGTVSLTAGVIITINGTFSVIGLNASARLFFKSATIGSTVNMIAATTSLFDCDFRDVIASGAATWSGTRIGDCGGNTGITFTTAKTVYFSLAAAGNWSLVAWATTSGGTPNVNNFPLPQDIAIINDASSNSGTTITLNQINSSYNFPTIDASSRTTALTINFASSTGVYYGGLLLSSAVTASNVNAIRFSGRGIYTLTVINNLLSTVVIDNVTGTINLGANLTTSSTSNIDQTSGKFNLNGYTVTASTYLNSGSLARTIIAPGTFSLSGVSGNVWSTASNIIITNPTLLNVIFTGAIASGSTLTVNHNGAGINFATQGGVSGSTIAFRSTALTNNLDFTGTRSTITNVILNISGNINLGTTASFTTGTNPWNLAATSGSKTITTNGITITWPLTKTGAGTYTLADNLLSTKSYNQTNGIFNDGGFNSTFLSITLAGASARTMFINGNMTCLSNWLASGSNAKFIGSGVINMSSGSAISFTGGSFNYDGITLNQGGSGSLTIIGNNRFYNISNTVQPSTILFTGGSTNIFSKFSLNGTVGNLITIGSTTTTKAILKKPSSFIMGANSVDNGNNTGLIFANNIANDNISASYIQAMLTPNNFILLCK